MANFEDAYKAYTEGGRGKAVAGVYDAQTQAELGGLKAAYDTNLANQQAAREKIGATYQQAGNTMQAQYERNRRNLNQQAAANGINTGAGSQQQLALQNTWNRDYGALQGQQAQAYADADREIANLQVTYQNAIQQAQAQGDYRKMAALLDDYNQQYNQKVNEAKLLAAYGDFSGYNGLYSDQQIANMRSSWIAQNPLLAYNTGAISAADYQRMTGQYAPGYAPASTPSYRSTYTPDTPPPEEVEGEDVKSERLPAKVQSIVKNSSSAQQAAQKLINAGLFDKLTEGQKKAFVSATNSSSLGRNEGKALAYADQYMRETGAIR